LAAGVDVNAKMSKGMTPLDIVIEVRRPESAHLLRKHVGKMGEELKAEGR